MTKRKIAKNDMYPIQVRLTKELTSKVDRLVKRGIYPNRSEAVRDAVRRQTFK